MKIGIDARMFDSQFTGIGRYVYELTRHLFELDRENDYVLFMNEPQFSSFIPPNGRISKILANARHYSWMEQTKFLSILWRENVDLMHFTHFNVPLFYRRPFIVTIHDLTLSFFPGKKITSWIHRLGYHVILRSAVKRARNIIALSHNTASDLTRLLQIDSAKISVIYAGVNEKFTHLKVSKDKSLLFISKPFFLYTGVWRNHKNLVRLIHAFNIVINERDLDADLVITGREDPFYPEVKETVSQCGLNDRVHFTGLVDEETLVRLYNLARVYVFPSLYEGFGLPSLEAFACGTPVCASNVSCIPEICADAALFFNPYDEKDMAAKMFEVWSNESLRSKLRDKGFERVKEFSWKKMAEETLKVYSGIAC